jgi:secreted PhoX family phosphatase
MTIQERLLERRLGRRRMLGLAGGTAAATVLGTWGLTGAAQARAGFHATPVARNQAAGFGELIPDPKGRLALPPGFLYRELSPLGATLGDGSPVPAWHDGMAAFPGPRGTTILVRNHEIGFGPDDAPGIIQVTGKRPYSQEGWGGTTAVVVDADRNEVDSFVSSSGTMENCAGGATPWGTWLTCEETTSQLLLDDGFTATKAHGYVYEVDPADPENALARTPIKEMGVFSHEAIAYDTDTGIVYLTEDGDTEEDTQDPSKDVGGSFLYRFIPTNIERRPGALQEGGKLQALAAVEKPTANDADLIGTRSGFGVNWIDVDPEGPTEDALAKECLRFNRLEGAHFAGGAVWFCDTSGGQQRLGQIFRYIPASNTLELFYEGEDAAGIHEGEDDSGRDYARLDRPDNITIAPWGDVIVAEDGGGINKLVGFTPEGESYLLAIHTIPYPFLEAEGLPENFRSEVAGPTFSRDGTTLFFNVQDPGVTFAVWGPFAAASAARRSQMSFAAPPAALAPFISADLRDAADRFNLSILEAAAFHRLGVPIL